MSHQDTPLSTIEDVRTALAFYQMKGEKPPMDQELADKLKRWRQADQWLREHMSARKVWPMLKEHYGYSEATARRDVECAMAFFGELKTHKKSYWAGLVLDVLGESLIKAVHDRKWRDVASIAREIREYLKFADEAEQEELNSLTKPVVRQIAFQPDVLNVERDPNAREKVLALLKLDAGSVDQSIPPADVVE